MIECGQFVQRFDVQHLEFESASAERLPAEGRLEVTGRLGYVPVTFAGLKEYKGFSLQRSDSGKGSPVDPSIHGKDFWQAGFDPARRTWSLTYNVPLDSPGDRPETVRLVLLHE